MKKMWKIMKNERKWWNLEETVEKNAFFENAIFGIFWVAKKSKNRIIKNVKIWSNDAKFLSRDIKEGC